MTITIPAWAFYVLAGLLWSLLCFIAGALWTYYTSWGWWPWQE